MNKKAWLMLFLIIYGIFLVIFMFSNSERPFWYEISRFAYFIIVCGLHLYDWCKNRKAEKAEQQGEKRNK